jgi:hypothetical protein
MAGLGYGSNRYITVYHCLLIGVDIDIVLGRLSACPPVKDEIHVHICRPGFRLWLSCKQRYICESHLAKTVLRKHAPVAANHKPDVLRCYTTKINSGIVCVTRRTGCPGKFASCT